MTDSPHVSSARHRSAQLDAMRVMAGADDWKTASKDLVRVLADALGWDAGALWTVHEPSRTLRCDAFWHHPSSESPELEAVSKRTFFARGECLPGRVWSLGSDLWVRELARDVGFVRGREASADGLSSACATPLRASGQVVGVLELFTRTARDDDPFMRALLGEIGEQIGRLRERMWTEEGLNDSQQLYRDLFASIQDAVIVTDADRFLLDANAAFTEIFGYAVDELRGRSVRPIYLSEADFRSVGRILPRGRDAKPASRAMKLRRKSGEGFEAEINIFPLQGSRSGGFVGVIRDLTERRKAERAMVRLEERFSRVFRSSPVAIGMGSAHEGRIIDVNDRYLEFFGYTREEVIGKTVHELGLWADAALRAEVIARLRRDGEVRSQEATFLRKSGEARAGLISMVVVEIEDEEVFIVMLVDITERKRSEDALARSKAQLSLLVESLPVVVYTARAEGDFSPTWVSSNATTVMGHSPEEFTTNPTFWRDRLHPADTARVLDLLSSVLELGRQQEFEYRWRVADGTYQWIHDVVRVVDSPDGERYLLGVAYDVTARRTAEAQRAEIYEAERSARAEAEATLSRIRAIQSVTDTALTMLSLDDLLREILARLRGLLRADMALIMLLDEEERCLKMRAGDGLDMARAGEVQVPLGRGISGRIAATRSPVVIEDVSRAEVPDPFLRENASSLLGVPLIVEGQVIGVLHVGSRVRRHFAPEDMKLLEMVADRVSPAIDRAHLFEEVRSGREQLQRLSRRLVELQEAERSEIARELHDEIGQLLTGLKLLLESDRGTHGGDRGGAEARGGRVARSHQAARSPAPGDPEASDPQQEIHSIVDDLLGRVRNLSMDLRPTMLDQLGLTPALLWHIERYETQTGIGVTFRHKGVERRFSPGMEIGAFRIVQEALTNVARHSGSRAAVVEVRADDELLEIKVADEGKGFDPERAQAAAASSGLAGMRERASALGGRVKIVSSSGAGAMLVAELPISARQASSKG